MGWKPGLLVAGTVLLVGGCAATPASNRPSPIDLGSHMSRPCKLLTPELRRDAGIAGETDPGKVNTSVRSSCAAFNDADTSGFPAINLALLASLAPTKELADRPGEELTVLGYRAALWSQSDESADDCDLGIDLGVDRGIRVSVSTHPDARPTPCTRAKEAAVAIIGQLRAG